MWILPKNYQLSSHFAVDMVASKEDLTLPGLNIEQSLMARSKPTRLRTWQTRWKTGSFYPHLFGRILNPCQWSRFETKLTSLLAAIHVNHSVQQESDLEKMTPDTCGLTSGDTLNQLDLFGASLKTSKDTSVSDLEKSLATWKLLVIKRRGEYSQRVKLALLTRESESISWRTPSVQEPGISVERLQTKDGRAPQVGQRLYDKHTGRNCQIGLSQQVKIEPANWPTPNTMDHLPQRSEEALIRQATTTRKGRTNPSNLREAVNPTAVAIYKNPTNWATPRAADSAGGPRTLNEKGQRISVSDPTKTYGANLSDQVRHWPTPSARDHKGAVSVDRAHEKLKQGHRAHMGTLDAYSVYHETYGPPDLAKTNTRGKPVGQLNANWVEHLMGVPTGWTGLGSWEMA